MFIETSLRGPLIVCGAAANKKLD